MEDPKDEEEEKSLVERADRISDMQKAEGFENAERQPIPLARTCLDNILYKMWNGKQNNGM